MKRRKSSQVVCKENPIDKFQQENRSKPYEGYRRNRGMPSAREPIEEYTEAGRKTFERIFGSVGCNNQKNVVQCTKVCPYNAPKHASNCIMYTDISDCVGIVKKKNVKIEKPNYVPKLKSRGIYDGD